jgi:ABC-type nickel/cobalt efflux system permease component RcnA
MPTLDHWIAHLGAGGAMGIVIAVLLGLRHATDPDHLTAVSSLVLGDQRDGARRAGVLGLAWGLGHATTLFAFGLPVVLFHRYLPDAVRRLAEATIGVVIVALAVRLLVRWRRGYYHNHLHSHGDLQHSHPHVHNDGHTHAARAHRHPHAESLGRTPLASFGIGLVHGVGGSAGVGILLVSAIPDRSASVIALFLFAAATAVSMALLSTAFGYALVRGPVSRRLVPLVPVMGVASLAYGVWYAVGAW